MQRKSGGVSKIHFVLGGAALLLLVLTMLAAGRFSGLESASRWRAHTYQVLIETRGCDKALSDMESGAQGFLLSGEQLSLQPYTWGKNAFSRYYGRVQAMTSDNAQQQKRLQLLKKQFEHWLKFYIPVITLRRDSDNAARAQQAAQAQAPRRDLVLKGMRRTIAEMGAAERSLLLQRAQEELNLREGTRQSLLGCSALSFLLAALLAVSMARGQLASSAAPAPLPIAPVAVAPVVPVAAAPVATPRKSIFAKKEAPVIEVEQRVEQGSELHHHNQQMLDSTSEGIIAFNLRGRVTFANPAALIMTGRELHEVIGKPVDAILERSAPEESLSSAADSHLNPISALLQDDRVHHATDEMFSRKDGTHFPVEYTITPLLAESDNDGEDARGIDGAVVVFRDIAERKRAEVALLRLASIVESSRDAILSHTLDGRIVSWNAAATALYGYSPQEVEGRFLSILFPPESGEELDYLRERIEQGERVEPYQTVVVTKDGTNVEVALTLYPVRDAQGRVMGASSNARPIARRRNEALPAFPTAAATLPASTFADGNSA